MSYQFGAGVSVELTQALFASINYIYQPLTRFETSGGKEAWSNDRLYLGDAYAHSVFFTFTHVLTG